MAGGAERTQQGQIELEEETPALSQQLIEKTPEFTPASAADIVQALDQQLGSVQKQKTHPLYGNLLYTQADGSKVYSTSVSVFAGQVKDA